MSLQYFIEGACRAIMTSRLDAEEQRIYSDFLPVVSFPSYPAKETCLAARYFRSHSSCSCYQKVRVQTEMDC